MKSGSSSRNPLLSYLRTGSGVTLISAAATMAFVAIKTPTTSATASAPTRNVDKFRQDRDELLGNKLALPGDKDFGPLSAAIEDFAHRAIPLDDIPTEASQNAISGFNRFVATTKGIGNGKKAPGAWHLIGP